METRGYGDLASKSPGGKVIGVLLMLSGMGFLSLFTATIASNLVARRIKEERGLDNVRWRDHILVCGWNQYGERVLQGLLLSSGREVPIVLVNDRPEEVAHDII